MSWTHKVVKAMKGVRGTFEDFPGKGYDSEEAAIAAARSFAEQQHAAGVYPCRVKVIARRGNDWIMCLSWDHSSDDITEEDYRDA